MNSWKLHILLDQEVYWVAVASVVEVVNQQLSLGEGGWGIWNSEGIADGGDTSVDPHCLQWIPKVFQRRAPQHTLSCLQPWAPLISHLGAQPNLMPTGTAFMGTASPLVTGPTYYLYLYTLKNRSYLLVWKSQVDINWTY